MKTTNLEEMTISEMENVDGGSIVLICCVIAGVGLGATGMYVWLK